MQALTRGPICALAAVLAGCTTASPVDDASRREWRFMCECLGTRDESLAIAVLPPSLTRDDEASLERIAATAAASVVWIETISTSQPAPDTKPVEPQAHNVAISDGKTGLSGGTGVVVQEAGLILTNEHVVRGVSKIDVILADGSRYTARSIASADHLDLALLQIDRRDLRAIPTAVGPPRNGDPVVAIGGRRFTEASGRRSGRITQAATSLQTQLDPARRNDYSRLVESTVRLEPGFSGGPLLDSRGRLVGLNVAMVGHPGQAHSRGYAIRFDRITREVLDELAAQISEADQ